LSVSKGAIGAYVHSAVSDGLGKIGVLVALESPGKTDELVALGRQLAMHVASANPQALDQASLDPALIKREKDVLADKFRQQGKPENVIEKIVESGLKTFYKEVCLIEQPFIFDDKKTVAQALDDMQRRGIRHLFYLQVDNPLVDLCGPEFVGYHVLAGSELSSQVVAKRDPLERLGNVIEADGKLLVIEYSDLPDDAAARRNSDGSLAIWAGSIAVHVIEAALLLRLAGTADGLPFHIARKKVAHVDSSGKPVEPQQPNAIKFERFIFDLMPLARNAIVVEVDRGSAFAPLKNAVGAKEDTPESVRGQWSALHRAWLRQAGAEVPDDVPVEISPLFALDAEELAAKLPRGTRISQPTYFA
jgi:hypothetical protein